MKKPIVCVKPLGPFQAVHVTHTDSTTRVPAYYDTEAQASYVAGFLQGRYDQAPPTASVEDEVVLAIETVLELSGQLPPNPHLNAPRTAGGGL